MTLQNVCRLENNNFAKKKFIALVLALNVHSISLRFAAKIYSDYKLLHEPILLEQQQEYCFERQLSRDRSVTSESRLQLTFLLSSSSFLCRSSSCEASAPGCSRRASGIRPAGRWSSFLWSRSHREHLKLARPTQSRNRELKEIVNYEIFLVNCLRKYFPEKKKIVPARSAFQMLHAARVIILEHFRISALKWI